MKQDSQLDPELKKVAREGGTEAPFSGKYWDEHTDGMYKCAICGTELFSSDTKFDSGTGWPSFTDPANLEHIDLVPLENSRTLLRQGFGGQAEVKCKKCGAHLGHVFDDGPDGKQRYCINSVCLELEEK